MKRATALFAKRIRDPAERSAAQARLRTDIAGEGVATADVMIEAIFEDLEAKRALYAQAEPRLAAAPCWPAIPRASRLSNWPRTWPTRVGWWACTSSTPCRRCHWSK
jgi:hypothetical protein